MQIKQIKQIDGSIAVKVRAVMWESLLATNTLDCSAHCLWSPESGVDLRTINLPALWPIALLVDFTMWSNGDHWMVTSSACAFPNFRKCKIHIVCLLQCVAVQQLHVPSVVVRWSVHWKIRTKQRSWLQVTRYDAWWEHTQSPLEPDGGIGLWLFVCSS